MEDKKLLLKLARETLLSHFKHTDPDLNDYLQFEEKKGIFVTLYVGKEIRGCKGILTPIYPMYKAVIEAVKSAAFEDTRHPVLIEPDLSKIKIEISILTQTKMLRDPEKYSEQIEIGKDGLYLVAGDKKGLLLPQIAIQKDMTQKQFLNAVSQSAGLGFSAWQDPENKVFKFQAEVLKEE